MKAYIPSFKLKICIDLVW